MPTTSGTRTRGAGGRFASSKGFFTTDTLTKGIAQFEFKMREHMELIALEFAVELQNYAQNHAPWNDRTGDARQGLQADTFNERDSMGVIIFHTVEYGIWLEVRWGGRYAIIIPTVEQKGPELLARMQGIMSRIVFYE